MKILFLWIDLKRLGWEKYIVLTVKSIKKFVKPKISYICYKTLLLSSICNKFGIEYEKIFKEESIETFKVLSLINNIEKYRNI